MTGTNRLAGETSPYLQQHKDNPVDWYPWGDEAFGRAAKEDKPVLLSVGYSACHWCHVMAHESFEDPQTAAVMNELYVNVKVDREERPDVDAVYMEATQAMTGGGGWPMTVFLTPDARPFFAGTYFPPRAVHGRPGFVDVLQAVHEAWVERRDEVEAQAEQLSDAIRESALSRLSDTDPVSLSLETGFGDVLQAAYQTLRQAFDPQSGGFGRAPKFPQVTFLELVFRAHAHNGSDDTLQLITTTLDAMASGGIYDHLGGGFSRYSVDNVWLVPHFEKMLYDQAQLLRAYAHGWQVTGKPEWRQVAEEIVGYTMRDLRDDDSGGFYSAEDADSEGEEGKFYVWSFDDVQRVGGDVAVDWYGVSRGGNFEGHNILNRPVRGNLVRPRAVEDARQRLFDERATRVRPGLDDKALTEWNAMFVSALAEAGAAFDNGAWLDEAARTADFLLAHLRVDGRWRRAWQRGRTNERLLAYAADHAWLVDAFTRLAEARGEARWIDEARAAADAMLDLFWDDADGGLFTTGRDAEQLIVRQKDHYDGATPSANGVAAIALVRLGALTGEARYTDAADAILRWLAPAVRAAPQAFTTSLVAADLRLTGVTEVVVPGGARRDLVQAAQSRFLPTSVLAWGEPYPSPLWDSRDEGKAYVCRNYACLQPVTDVDALGEQLTSASTSAR